jgi:osmotically-inducible protein OsmY
MSRYDEWRKEREWRGRDRGGRDEQHRRESFYPGNHGFEENADSGRTAGDDDRQPYSQDPYGRYPGQQRPGGGRAEWQSSPSRGASQGYGPPQGFGQREPYNEQGSVRGGSRYSESQYSENQYSGNQYGSGRGGRQQYADYYGSDPHGSNQSRENDYGRYAERAQRRYERSASESLPPSRFDRSRFDQTRFDRGSGSGDGPFADTSQSPRFFGTGYYGDGGASYTGGFDERQGQRDYGVLYGREQRDEPSARPQRRYGSGPKGYTRSDERLREDISERLMMADSIDSSEVSVIVKDAKVTLEGSVPNRRMKHAIEDLADQCPGVQDVDNRIRVRREEWGAGSTADSASSTSSSTTASNLAASSNTMTASGVTPTSGSSGTTSSGKVRKE